MKNDPNMPAFPVTDNTYGGLTIRQHFAALAMQGIIANQRLIELLSNRATELNRDLDNGIAEMAVEASDALIRALNKEPPHAAK